MVKKKICRKGFYEGYWKGEKIGLVPRYSPHGKPEEYVIEEVEVGEDDTYPRLIDLSETSLTEIKEICEANGFSFFWVTGLARGEGGNLSIQKTDLLGKVMDLFIAMCAAGSTPAQYRRFFDSLVKADIVNLAWNVGEYEEKREEVIKRAYELPDPKTKEARHQSRHILIAFHAFLDNPNHCEISKTTGHYQSKRRKDFLTDEEAAIFFPALEAINPTYELIGRILRYYNREMFENPSEGFIVPIEYLLQMQTHQVGDRNPPTICGYKLGRNIQFAVWLREDLFERLVVLARQNDLFVFQNRRGGPIDSAQIRRAFQKASKACGLRPISPVHLC